MVLYGKRGEIMQDFPFFTTEFGVSGLILKEIPYRKEAYIRLHTVQPGFFREHLRECAAFCRMAGAERILAAGSPELEAYPLHTSVVQMCGTAWVDARMLANLFPVTDATVGRWRRIYNERMARVDNAGTLEAREEARIVKSGGAYFVHDSGELLGIGWLEDCRLLAVAGVKKGAGETVMHTLMSLVEGAQMTLEVASTNGRAIDLYEKLGFVKTKEISRWYDVS